MTASPTGHGDGPTSTSRSPPSGPPDIQASAGHSTPQTGPLAAASSAVRTSPASARSRSPSTERPARTPPASGTSSASSPTQVATPEPGRAASRGTAGTAPSSWPNGPTAVPAPTGEAGTGQPGGAPDDGVRHQCDPEQEQGQAPAHPGCPGRGEVGGLGQVQGQRGADQQGAPADQHGGGQQRGPQQPATARRHPEPGGAPQPAGAQRPGQGAHQPDEQGSGQAGQQRDPDVVGRRGDTDQQAEHGVRHGDRHGEPARLADRGDPPDLRAAGGGAEQEQQREGEQPERGEPDDAAGHLERRGVRHQPQLPGGAQRLDGARPGAVVGGPDQEDRHGQQHQAEQHGPDRRQHAVEQQSAGGRLRGPGAARRG